MPRGPDSRQDSGAWRMQPSPRRAAIPSCIPSTSSQESVAERGEADVPETQFGVLLGAARPGWGGAARRRPTDRYELQFNVLLSRPILLLAMVLIAANVSRDFPIAQPSMYRWYGRRLHALCCHENCARFGERWHSAAAGGGVAARHRGDAGRRHGASAFGGWMNGAILLRAVVALAGRAKCLASLAVAAALAWAPTDVRRLMLVRLLTSPPL